MGSLNGKGVSSKLGNSKFLWHGLVGGMFFLFGGIGCAGRVTGVRPGLWFIFSGDGVAFCAWWWWDMLLVPFGRVIDCINLHWECEGEK